MTTFTVEPDADDVPTLWRANDEHDQRPLAVARLAPGGTLIGDDEGVVFRAAAAVLAPDEAVVEAMAEAIHEWNPLLCQSWEQMDGDYRDTRLGQARAALAALRDRAVASDG